MLLGGAPGGVERGEEPELIGLLQVCEAFGIPPWEAERQPSRWIDVCHAYLVWKNEEESKVMDAAKSGGNVGSSKMGTPLPPPSDHKRPSSRSR